jgi:hypothetical protein
MRNADCGLRTAILCAVASLICAAAPLRLSAQERTIPLALDGYVRVFNAAGSIRVIGWDLDSVRWGGTLAPGQELFGGGSRRMVKLGPSGPDGPAQLVVRLPRGAKLVIDGGESTVEVEGMSGPVEIRGGGGAVQVSGAPVRLTIETVDGAVTLAGGPFRSTEVRTAGGIIRVAGAREEIVLSTVTGAVTAEVAGVTRGRISSVRGVIRFSGSVDPTGTLAIESHGGDIDLSLDPRPGLELVVTAFGGSITNALTTSTPRPVRDGRSHLLETIVGDGGGTVTVTSFKGTVRVQPK